MEHLKLRLKIKLYKQRETYYLSPIGGDQVKWATKVPAERLMININKNKTKTELNIIKLLY